jgi:hypothetical protein
MIEMIQSIISQDYEMACASMISNVPVFLIQAYKKPGGLRHLLLSEESASLEQLRQKG